ncbi:hypothetical protein BP5796_02072 [Coleophoma crateriformis]|uniref:beta-glucosidase n=1 Tax=Coleophoma crateriformis TaxID=565419 RepID=A0A3D8T3V3_9HELO|nr:hypothetical protein BP5796_02072 [Coleophoma crateriformis]
MKASLTCSLCALSLLTRGLAATNSSTSSNSSTITTAYLADGYLDLGIASDAYEKAKAFVAPLNNTQKIDIITASSFTSGNSSWTGYENQGGVSGLNKFYYVSAFPMGNSIIQTWSRDLIAAQFKAVGDEFFASGVSLVDSVVIGPLGRVPEGGRSNEAFSPDPFLSGVAAAEAVSGQQSAGVVAGIRHFVLYEQESNRTGSNSGGGGMMKRDTSSSTVYSSNTDDKTIRELYLAPWSAAIHAGAQAVMCAMNLVNGTHSCENNELLSARLKTDLGFAGFVYPDQEAQFTSYGSAIAGLDYSALSGQLWTDDILLAGIANGSFSQERLDDMAVRAVLPYYFVGLDTADLPTLTDQTSYRNVRGNHSALIRKIGGEAIALLKNNVTNGGGLPLSKPESITLFGAHAGAALAGPNFAFSVSGTTSNIYEGHMASGGGSGQTSLPYLITPFNSITQRAVEDNTMLWWVLNNTYTTTTQTGGIQGIGGGTGISPSITNYAAVSEACLVFINSWSGEGADRTELYNTEQDTLVSTVADNCNNTIVVVNVAGTRILEAWIEHENVTAVLYSGGLGQQSGNAIADVLYGDVNPSAKLTNTIAKQASDYPASVCQTVECPFSEGVYIDYRWFDKEDIEPRFPFGHGLSYTEFTYGMVTTTVTNSTALASKYPTGTLGLGGISDMFDEVIKVNTTIANTGAVDGAEVAQLYLSFPDEAEQPIRILRGFEKVTVVAGTTVDVSFSILRRDVSYWNTLAQSWAIASGEYTFSIGSSSRDIRSNATLTI